MKRIFMFFTAFAVLFVFNACASKAVDPMQERIEKHIVFEGLSKDIVKSFNYRTNSNSLLEVELILLSRNDKTISYEISWFDEDGFKIQGPAYADKKDKLKLKKNKEFVVQRVAANKDAVSFKITLKKG